MTKMIKLPDNIYIFPEKNVDATGLVDDMLVAYWKYTNNMFCKDADLFWGKFLDARQACRQIRNNRL